MKRTSLGQPGKRARRWGVVVGCLPLALAMGCPQDQARAPGRAQTQITAPSMPAPTPMAAGAVAQAGVAPKSASVAAAVVTATPQSPAQAQKVQQLIQQAERAYASGVANYRAGKLDAARNDFDFAVDLFLTSGMDLKTDAQMSEELDRLVSAVNSLEMAALKQGNGFSAPVEAAPVDAANDVTFAPNPELTAKLNGELKTTESDLPLVINDTVAGYIGYFSSSPSFHAHMLRSLERVGKYRSMIERVLKEEGVPQDMIYLAVAESGFQPQALNASSGAGGMWQFMPYLGAYGLARNGWIDERFDPEKSSRAYARYIKTLYKQFGDWYLAMAAYDWGPGNVQRAVMRTGYADFWELYRRNVLPTETKNYVPKILAAVIMAKNPERYGLDKLVPAAAVVSDTVQTDTATDLRLVADVTEASVGEIVALNPSLLRLSTPRDMTFDLRIPLGTKDTYTERMKAIPIDKRASWRFHVARDGETLESIAAELHSHASDVAAASGLNTGDSVEAGDELVIPVAAATANGTHPQRYKVRRGDTLVTVADRFNVSAEDLRRWNHMSSSTVSAGRTLAVTEPVRLAPTAHLRGRGRGSRGRGAAATASRGRGVGKGSRASGAARSTKSSGVKRSSARAATTGKKPARKAAR